MAVNKIFEFGKDAAAYVLSDGDYLLDGERVIGNQPGIARADFVNKAIRQSAYMAAMLAQFIVDYAEETVQDSDDQSVCLANFVTALSLIAGFAAGTNMVFFQAAAPTGWTQVTTYTDMALRVVSTAGGGIGGTHNLSSPPSTAHVHIAPTTGQTVLTGDQIPAHTHTVAFAFDTSYAQHPAASGNYQISSAGSVTGSTGGGRGHDHPGGGNTSSTSPTAFAPKYIDVIVATKD